MTRAENLTSLNRSPEHRAGASERAAHYNTGNTYRRGKFAIPDDVIDEMVAIRQRGRSWGVIRRMFHMSAAGARHRVIRRRGQI